MIIKTLLHSATSGQKLNSLHLIQYTCRCCRELQVYAQCKIKESVSTEYCPASGAQVVNQTALKERKKQCDIFIDTA